MAEVAPEDLIRNQEYYIEHVGAFRDEYNNLWRRGTFERLINERGLGQSALFKNLRDIRDNNVNTEPPFTETRMLMSLAAYRFHPVPKRTAGGKKRRKSKKNKKTKTNRKIRKLKK